MPIERSWAIIISALLATVLLGKILWENRRTSRFEAIATFEGFGNRPRARSDESAQEIITEWPPKRYALLNIKQVVHSNMGYQAGAMCIGLPDRPLKTNQGYFLVKGQTYSFHLSRRIINRKYRVKVFEMPTASTAK